MKVSKLKEINDFMANSLPGHMEMEIIEVGEGFVKGKMPVNQKTRQPYGLLHGGASTAFAETLGSLGSALTIVDQNFFPVGIEINATHVRKVADGYVTGEASLIQKSRKMHVWDIRILNQENELVCMARHTVLIVEKR